MIWPAKLLCTALVTAILSTVCMVSASAANVGVDTANTDALRFRDEASTPTTALGTISRGGTVVVLEDADNGQYKAGYKPMEGYMPDEHLNVSVKADVTIGYGLIQSQGPPLNICSSLGTSHGKVISLSNGAVVNIMGTDNGWYKISTNGVTGYASSDYMATCKDSTGSHGNGATAVATASSNSLGQQAVDYVKQYLGCLYVYGGNGPGSFDCSGYTSCVYHHFGYVLNRIASIQLPNGISIPGNELQPGGLVFSRYNTSKAASYVSIYIDGGQFVYASVNTYTVRTDDLTHGHYANVYMGAHRVL